VTGGSGFIGACLARRLIAAGHKVYLLLRPEAQTWRLRELEGQYTPLWADLRDADGLRQAVRSCRPEVVYHLATHGAYPTQRDRATILATNLLGLANLLDALAGTDYRALVHTGSSSEYGHKAAPMREDDLPQPRTDYGVTKAAATLLCQAEAYRGAPVVTVRVFSAYGPWEEPSRLVPYVLDCCLRGVPARVTAGQQPRDFIYVDDVVGLLELAAHEPRCHGQILHAGTGVQHSIRDMVAAIVAVSGRCGLQVEFGAVPPRSDEPKSWVASIDRTVEVTGWRPRFDLRAGVAQSWAWFAANHGKIGCAVGPDAIGRLVSRPGSGPAGASPSQEFASTSKTVRRFDPRQLRKTVLRMAHAGASVHIGCAFSLIEVLAVLYRSHLRLGSGPDDPQRDYLVLSKGHGVMAQYACLHELGWLCDADLDSYFRDGTRLKGLSDAHVPGLEVSSGSLGHGLSVGVGLALAAKRQQTGQRCFAIVGDGEINEGAIWEALLFTSHFALDNLVVIVDANGFQAMGSTREVMDLGNIGKKLTAFGLETLVVNGHDEAQLDDALTALCSSRSNKPRALVAQTTKGCGVSFMAGDNRWHYTRLNPETYARALAELGG
jgi:transketolase